jgi:hypothetical protein
LTSRSVSFLDDVACVGQRAREPVELGYDERVAGAARGQRLAQAGTIAIGAREPVVDVDTVGGDSERGERVPLGREVLLVGRNAGVPDLQSGHG